MRNSVNREMLRPEQNIKDYDTMYLVSYAFNTAVVFDFPSCLLSAATSHCIFLHLSQSFFISLHLSQSISNSSLLFNVSISANVGASFYHTASHCLTHITSHLLTYQDDYIEELVVPKVSKDGGEKVNLI